MEDEVRQIMEENHGKFTKPEKPENPCFYHPEEPLPCTSCVEGVDPTRTDVSTRDFTVLIRGTIQDEVMDEGGVRKLHMKTMKRMISQSIIFDDRVATFDDVEIIVKR